MPKRNDINFLNGNSYTSITHGELFSSTATDFGKEVVFESSELLVRETLIEEPPKNTQATRIYEKEDIKVAVPKSRKKLKTKFTKGILVENSFSEDFASDKLPEKQEVAEKDNNDIGYESDILARSGEVKIETESTDKNNFAPVTINLPQSETVSPRKKRAKKDKEQKQDYSLNESETSLLTHGDIIVKFAVGAIAGIVGFGIVFMQLNLLPQ